MILHILINKVIIKHCVDTLELTQHKKNNRIPTFYEIQEFIKIFWSDAYTYRSIKRCGVFIHLFMFSAFYMEYF